MRKISSVPCFLQGKNLERLCIGGIRQRQLKKGNGKKVKYDNDAVVLLLLSGLQATLKGN